MTLNTLDGIMAIERGHLSLKGEIVNAFPDRYSDIFMIAGIALSPLCRDWLGIAALCTMFLVSYSGMMGKALTVSWQHHGPMGKVERLIVIMVFALVQFVVLPENQSVKWLGIDATPMEWAMGFIMVFGQYTVFRRLNGQLREIRYKEGSANSKPMENRERAIVVYDSNTHNTQKIAEQIAQGLSCSAKSVSEVENIESYKLVVLGSPNIRKRPTASMKKFQENVVNHPELLGVFTTFGLPIWGHITARYCLNSMAQAWNMKPLAKFSCPGYHQKYKTYKRRPNENDFMKAFLFGLKLSKKLKKAG
jgi:phosphatidylglycerophosphate synthase/flavodoxin